MLGKELFELNLNELLFKAQEVHRKYHDNSKIQKSELLSIKTGACPEDCKYCSQSGHYKTNLKKEKLLDLNYVLEKAKTAKDNGMERFCMAAAWRNPPKKDFDQVLKMVSEVKALGLETCVSLGSLDENKADKLKKAGLDYYNHNIDTSENYYKEVITTRTFEDRLKTLKTASKAGIKLCCGGILGLGETREDRISMLVSLSKMEPQPESVPINKLVPIPGTPLGSKAGVDNFEYIRTVAVARILLPKAKIRISAGRESMSAEMQALCFLAGANSVFCGDKLLTTKNTEINKDNSLFKKMGFCDAKANHS